MTSGELASRRSGRTTRRLLGVGVLVPIVLSCTGRYGSVIVSPSDLGWPAYDPQIRLEKIIDLDAATSRGRGKLSRWLGEKRARSFRRPYAVTWESDDLLVADPDSGSVARVDLNGRIEFAPAELFVQPIGVAACWEGITVSDSALGGIAFLDRDLRLVSWLAEGLSRPTGLVCADDRLYVAETGRHRVLVLKQFGERASLGDRGSGPGKFNFPTSLAVQGESLLVGDAMNFRVQRIALPSGDPLDAFGALGDAPGEMPRLKGIAVDRVGNLWVADAYLDQVAVYNARGKLLISIGGQGSGSGEFSFPAGIAAHPDGRVVVVDSLNRRLKVFRVLEAGAPGRT